MPPHRYEAALRANNAVDFDDLLGLSVALLASNEAVRQRYHRRFRCEGRQGGTLGWLGGWGWLAGCSALLLTLVAAWVAGWRVGQAVIQENV